MNWFITKITKKYEKRLTVLVSLSGDSGTNPE
jgi:hypothetical protein